MPALTCPRCGRTVQYLEGMEGVLSCLGCGEHLATFSTTRDPEPNAKINSGATATRKKHRWLVWSIVLIGLGAVGFGIAASSTYSLSDKDKSEVNRLMIAWAVDGQAIPGWNEQNPLLDETRKAKRVHVIFPLFDYQSLEKDRHVPAYSDPRFHILAKKGDYGAEGDQATDVTLAIHEDGSWDKWRTTLTMWTPSSKGDLRIRCEWSKRLWGLKASVTAEMHVPGFGWQPFGKKK